MSASGVPMGAERESAEVADSGLKKVQEFLDLVEEYELPTPHPLISQDLYDALRSLTSRLSELEAGFEAMRRVWEEAASARDEARAKVSRLEEALERIAGTTARPGSVWSQAGARDWRALKFIDFQTIARTALDSETPPLITTPPGFEKPVDGNIVPLDEDDPTDSETREHD